MHHGALRVVTVTATLISAGTCAHRALAQATLPVDYGEVVHTFEAPNDLGNVVVTLIDTTPASLQSATPGVNYFAPIFWNAGAGANEWTFNNLGQVYGVTLDHSYPNIYVTAAGRTIYPASGNVYGPLGAGGVYRLDGSTGGICPLAVLPNHPTLGPGLGNITYSAKTNSLYVSDFEDGLIYRLPLGPSAALPVCPVPSASIRTYDHGLTGRPAFGLAPIPDDGVTGTMTALGRRVWGLAVHQSENRLYYGVWSEDAANSSNSVSNEVWSVRLDAAGDPIPSTAFPEISMPPFIYSSNPPPFPTSSPVAGLNFTPTGSLLVAERTIGAHQSRLLEYTGATHAWIPQPINKYLVGVNNTSCTGAGDMDCESNVWTAGDGVILDGITALYGLMRIPAGGNTTAAPHPYSTSVLIDSDQEITQQDKTEIGSLVLRKECDPCRTAPPPPIVLFGAPDQRCGVLTANTYHYSIDSIGLVNNPGSYVTVGQQNTPLGLPGLHVVIWDRSGNILRQALFSTNTPNELIVATSVEADANCNLLIAGTTQVGGVPATFAAVLDPLLTPVWARRMPGNMNGGQSVQADWLTADGSIVVTGMDGTGSSPAVGRLTRLSSTGALFWSKRYTSGFGATRRILIGDVEQAPVPNGNIWVCGGVDWPAVGGGFGVLPMVMEVSFATGLPTGAGMQLYPFPAGVPWTTGQFNAIKFNPTIGATQGDILVAGWSTRPGPPFGDPITSPRIASILRASTPTQHWDNVYSGVTMFPGTSAISIAQQSFAAPNAVVIAGRTAGSPSNSLIGGLTLRVNEANGLSPIGQAHGSPHIPNLTYVFNDITPGADRVMIGGISDIQPLGSGGTQLWFSASNCPTSFTPGIESEVTAPQPDGEVVVSDAVITPLTLVEVPVVCPCTLICRQVLCSADFNGDGDLGTDADIAAFFACLSGDCCPTCQSADFNQDGNIGTDADIESFFRVLAGGSC